MESTILHEKCCNTVLQIGAPLFFVLSVTGRVVGAECTLIRRRAVRDIRHKKFKHTNEVYAVNEPNFLGLISYGTQQVEP